MLPHKQIELKLQAAVREILPEADVSIVLVRPCPDPKFGDYQSNALMSLARQRKMNPRQLATDVLAKLDVSDVCEKVEIAGAGFLNFRLKNSSLTQTLESAARGEHLFFEKVGRAAQPRSQADQQVSPTVRTAVIDFSSPNVAKPMHVGHIRSTILGDSLARTLRLLGHHVVTDNHIGDWGTQFGMLIAAWKIFRLKSPFEIVGERSWTFDVLQVVAALGEKEFTNDQVYAFESDLQLKHPNNKHVRDKIRQQLQELRNLGLLLHINEGVWQWVKGNAIAELEAFYKHFQKQSEDDPYLLPAAKLELVKLQSGDAENLKIWREMIALSQNQFDEIYLRLGVRFDETLGESFYNPKLKPLVDELLEKKIARESEGAIAIFFDDNPQLKEHPALIRKSDGGFNYTTTDLATLAYRLETWSPGEIIYVTDGRQQLHFQQLFAAFTKWHDESKAKLAHVWFGSILGEDGKPFKTRSGETVKLSDLLDEAELRAFKIVSEKSSDLSEAQRKEIARVIGIGAVKYADLLPNRQSDYVFSWDKMLALTGNTAPYLQYAYARIKSIFRKNEASSSLVTRHSSLALTAPEEIALAKHLLNFGLTLEAVAEEYRPNFLCNYLFELAGKFTGFYENCPVLKAEDAATRDSRLALCDLTARVLKQGLETLGIETVEQM